METNSIEQKISSTFGSYKAEWLKEELYELYSQPSYFPELLTTRPCVIMGGRGTGKTTVLRCLSYEGQAALTNSNTKATCDNFYGFYYRVNTNRVTAFDKKGKDEEFWTPIFSHYINLIISELAADFLLWMQRKYNKQIDTIKFQKVSKSLCIKTADSAQDFKENVEASKIELENYINNIDEAKKPLLSLQSAPIDILFREISDFCSPQKTNFFILIDEYENFLDYQQQVLNTLIKHSGENYTFKIGVRELGWRERKTLNTNETLTSPADYSFIDISDRLSDRFSEFAKEVCNNRLKRIQQEFPEFLQDIASSLCSMSAEEEAEQLGVESAINNHLELVKEKLPQIDLDKFLQKPKLEQYTLLFFATNKDNSISLKDLSRLLYSKEWKNKYDNYKFSLLFTICPKSSGIKKYYAGWSTFVLLSSGNIRYLMELVEQSLLMHIKRRDKSNTVSCETQTKAAIHVATKNINELEGLTTFGAQLTRLVLSLGRLFGLLAEDPRNKSPEITQFEIYDKAATSYNFDSERTHEIMKAAVMNLALIRLTGSKLSTRYEIKDHDYMLHPIFSPLFNFSYRKKRKMRIHPDEIIELIDTPQEGMKKIFFRKNILEIKSLPKQLTLFSGHYNEYP